MNKLKLACCIAYGLMIALMFFNLLLPESEQIYLAPNESGSFSRTISERDYTVEVRDLEHRTLRIDFKPKRELWDVLFPIAVGVAMGIAVFRNPPKSVKSQQVDADPRIVTEHRLYPDFLREDSDRAFFSGNELVAVFGSWLKNQPSAGAKGKNTNEHDGNPSS
ncbi:MAG: hypothetical protein MUF31_10965 [Akkermansiaceae bacterium]|jgi:hypothetical protein|nr:hypothetical protein [Akkermansiaceae bacterium]